MSKFILRHPVLWTSFSFLFIFLPQWLASVWSLFSPDPLVKIIYSKVGLTMPTFSSYWISIPIGFLMFGYLIYEQHFRKVPELGEIVQRKNNLKIEIEDIEITTSHSRGKDGESFIQEKQILKVTISLLPSMKMQIAKILLHMDDKIIEPSGPPIYASTLLLPYILEHGETHDLIFQFERKYAGTKNNEVFISILGGGETWKSNPFHINL